MDSIDSHTPEYTLEEKEKDIIIEITAPLSKPKEAAFVLEKDVFSFESPPYILKIKLPHSTSDRFSQQAYDSFTGKYKIKLKKSFDFHEEASNDDHDDHDSILQPLVYGESNPNQGQKGKSKQFYGFANKYSNMFGKLYYEFSDVINLPDPDYTPVDERKNLKIKEENEKWSESHYLADTMEKEHLESIFKYKPPWVITPLKDDFKNDEKQMLVGIIHNSKNTDLAEESVRLSILQMVDILFGYAYNKRTTEGDNTVESGWTINKLSSVLSWFEVPKDLKEVVINCYKRSLIFPLFRNWDLAKTVHKDVASILKIGSKQVTKCLLEVREIFNESENRYILNTLYINDLCNFAYHMTDERCWELSKEIEKINIKKHEVNSELPLLEVAAQLTLEEETNGTNEGNLDLKTIINKISNLNMSCKSDTTSDSSESDREESDSSISS